MRAWVTGVDGPASGVLMTLRMPLQPDAGACEARPGRAEPLQLVYSGAAGGRIGALGPGPGFQLGICMLAIRPRVFNLLQWELAYCEVRGATLLRRTPLQHTPPVLWSPGFIL